jgi:MFS transporter, FHS family, L-fucose permease
MATGIPTSSKFKSNAQQLGKSAILPLILITSLFFMWGVANNLNDILIKQFKKSFELSDFQSGLVQSAFYLGYFILAIPAAQLMRRLGYKTGILIGLVLYAIGAFLFYPAAEMMQYGFFLLALFVIASGLSFLETAANPYVTVLGPPETSEFRLNLAQSFNPMGSIAGIMIGRNFIFSGVEYTKEQLAALNPEQLHTYMQTETRAVQIPYLIIGCVVLLWAVILFFTKLPDVKEEHDDVTEHHSKLSNLWKYRHFKLGVLAQFFYVGAQVGIWSYMIRYSQRTMGVSEKIAADFLTYSLVGFLAGRFLGTFMMKFFKPNNIMAVFASLNVVFTAVSVALPGKIGVGALIVSSVFMSVMFPTIFALSLKGLGKDTKLGASLVIMAIIGGALLTALMGFISDTSGHIRYAMLIPFIGFAYVLWFAKIGSKPTSHEPVTSEIG